MTLFEFLSPYVRFFHGAAYNLHQTLDGLGISSAGFIEQAADGGLVGGFAPGEAVVPVLVAIMFLALCSLPLVLLAGIHSRQSKRHNGNRASIIIARTAKHTWFSSTF
jgi:hypothetical protein